MTALTNHPKVAFGQKTPLHIVVPKCIQLYVVFVDPYEVLT